MAEKDYIFATDQNALATRRIDMLEAILDPATFGRLQRLGIPRGARCLEVAGGRGSVALALLSLCGAEGQVVGTDIDLRWLSTIDAPNFEAQKHDILNDDMERLGTFDLVHCRFLLHHLPPDTREGIVRRLVGVLRPGGKILLEEPLNLNRSDRAHARGEAFERTMSQWRAWMAARTGYDLDFTVSLPRILDDAGLVETGNEINGEVTRGGDLFRRWLQTSFEISTSVMDMSGAWEGGDEALFGPIADPTLYWTGFVTLAAWGTRPTI